MAKQRKAVMLSLIAALLLAAIDAKGNPDELLVWGYCYPEGNFAIPQTVIWHGEGKMYVESLYGAKAMVKIGGGVLPVNTPYVYISDIAPIPVTLTRGRRV